MEGSEKKQVGSYEAKTRLAELLDRVEAGGRITITRHGRPVAQLVPLPGAVEETVDEAVEALSAFRATHPLGPSDSVSDLIRAGRNA